ncbi:MAG: hypothetical protein AAFY25_00925 [Pseudomonadota bacterium]
MRSEARADRWDDPLADILVRLEHTLDHAPLPDRLRMSGRALAERLASPVRLSVMGLPGVGKTTLIRAMLGPDAPLLPDHAPTYEMRFGATPAARITLEDGTTRDAPMATLGDALGPDSVFVEVESPCEALRNIRITELVTDGTDMEMAAAAPWAAARCEIPMWCSRDFDAREARIWSCVPAARKDHAMLVLTQADAVPAEVIEQRLEHAFDTEGTGFCIIAPVAAKHALHAQQASREEAGKVARASGIAALRDEIFRKVDQGRQVDLDHAEIFLTRFEKRLAQSPAKAAFGRAPGVASGGASGEASGGTPSEAIAQGVRYLRQQAEAMLTDIEEFGPFAPAKIVERCLESANTLVELIADDTPVGAAQSLAHSTAFDAADMLLLMTLENTAGAADDAVSLMVQVQREFELAA